MFVELCAYGFRDLVPLATWTELPLDRAEGSMLWAKVALLVLNAIVIPLFIPRRYVPLNPLVCVYLLYLFIPSLPMYIFLLFPSMHRTIATFHRNSDADSNADANVMSLSRTPNPNRTPNRQHLLFLWCSSISWIHLFGKGTVFRICRMKTCRCWQTMIMRTFCVCVHSRYVFFILSFPTS
jgi:hypothetical protein